MMLTNSRDLAMTAACRLLHHYRAVAECRDAWLGSANVRTLAANRALFFWAARVIAGEAS